MPRTIFFTISLSVSSIFFALAFNSAYAQGLKTSAYGSSSSTTQNKNSNGTEKITIKTTQVSELVGNTESQTMNISITGQGLNGDISPVINGTLNKMAINSDGELMMNESAFSEDQSAEMDAGISTNLTTSGDFSLSSQVDITQQSAKITSTEKKESLVELDEAFSTDSFTESFSSETGNYSGL